MGQRGVAYCRPSPDAREVLVGFMYSPAVPRDYAALKEDDDYTTMLLTVRETVAYQGFLAQSVLFCQSFKAALFSKSDDLPYGRKLSFCGRHKFLVLLRKYVKLLANKFSRRASGA